MTPQQRGNYSPNWWRDQGIKSLSNPPSGHSVSRTGFKPKSVFLQSTRSFHWPHSLRPHAQPQCSVPGVIISLVGDSYPCLGAWFWVTWSFSTSEKGCCHMATHSPFTATKICSPHLQPKKLRHRGVNSVAVVLFLHWCWSWDSSLLFQHCIQALGPGWHCPACAWQGSGNSLERWAFPISEYIAVGKYQDQSSCIMRFWWFQSLWKKSHYLSISVPHSWCDKALCMWPVGLD